VTARCETPLFSIPRLWLELLQLDAKMNPSVTAPGKAREIGTRAGRTYLFAPRSELICAASVEIFVCVAEELAARLKRLKAVRSISRQV